MPWVLPTTTPTTPTTPVNPVGTGSPTITTFTGGVTSSLANWSSTIPFAQTLTILFEQCYSIAVDQGDEDSPGFIPGWSTLLNANTCPTSYLPYLAQFVGETIPVGTDDQTARQIIKLAPTLQRGRLTTIQAAALRYLSGSSALVGTLQELAIGGPLPTNQVLTSIPTARLTAAVAPQTVTLTDPTGEYTQQFLVLAPGNIGDTSLEIYPTMATYAFPANSTISGPFLFTRERWNGTTSTADAYHLTLGFRSTECTDLSALTAAVNAVKPAGVIVDIIESNANTWSEASHEWEADTFTWTQADSETSF